MLGEGSRFGDIFIILVICVFLRIRSFIVLSERRTLFSDLFLSGVEPLDIASGTILVEILVLSTSIGVSCSVFVSIRYCALFLYVFLIVWLLSVQPVHLCMGDSSLL